METLLSSVKQVCLFSLAVSVGLFLCPENHLRKQIRFLVSLIFITAMIPPFLHTEFSGIPEEIQQSQADRTALALTEQSLKETLVSVLAENGIQCAEISVSLHMDENHCISINDVSLVCNAVQDAVRILREVLGEGVTLHVSEILE